MTTQRYEITEDATAAIAKVEKIRAAVAAAAKHCGKADQTYLELAAGDCTLVLIHLHMIRTQAEAATFDAPAAQPYIGGSNSPQ